MSQKMIKIETDEAPKAIGPYSQGIVIASSQSLVFISGQLPIDPKTGKFVDGDIKKMTQQVIENLKAILRASGCTLMNVVRTDVFLKDLKDFPAVNEEYSRHFNGPITPARQTIQVVDLPMGAPIEISCIAAIQPQ